jgi:hypothetical protein
VKLLPASVVDHLLKVSASQQEPDALAGASFSEESPKALNPGASCAHSAELEYVIDGYTPANNRADHNGATHRDLDQTLY